MMTTIKSKLKIHYLLFIILILFVVLRLPSLFEPYWYTDEGIYGSVAYGMSQGKYLYSGVYDHKPQLIFYIYLLAGNVDKIFWVKVFNLIAGMISVLGIYLFLKQYFKSSITNFTTVIFTILLATPLLEGNIANAENFFMPFVLFGLFFGLKNKSKYYLLAGLLFGIAFLIKFHPLFDFIALIWIILVINYANSNKITVKLIKATFSKLILLILGFVIPFILISMYEIYLGNFRYFVEAAYLYSFNYAGEVPRTENIFILFITSLKFKFAFATLMIFLTTYLFIIKKISKALFTILIVFIIELFAALLSGRVYLHYLLQPLMSFTLLLGYIISRYIETKTLKNKILYIFSLLFVTVIILLYFGLGYSGGNLNFGIIDKAIKYYYEFIINPIDDYRYNVVFGKRQQRLDILNSGLQKYNQENVYLHTNLSWAYYYTKTTPPVKYIVAFHTRNVGKNNFIAELRQANPSLIVLEIGETVQNDLQILIDQEYILDSTDEYFQYYIKNEKLNLFI
jgi:hypothetical protein